MWDRDPFLLSSVTITQRDRAIDKSVEIHGYAERCTNLHAKLMNHLKVHPKKHCAGASIMCIMCNLIVVSVHEIKIGTSQVNME